ncbi:SxtJ family membrane protein [Kaistia terrae]|uniref:SxtJ family membrane protein n=1 Tax=Kaistia terrae TaxID=537017 RepID=A0ABW0Q3Z9_9HYPH|nr:SxtJ family membrane protein [Kaistia terrae]MCX5578655.1 SxtJ family membrane protein [Kaistia terrae]
MIEPLVEHLPEGPTNRSFGYTVGSILIGLMLLRWVLSGYFTPISAGLTAVGAVLVLLALVAPKALTVPNRLWMKLGLLLFMIVNPVVMFLIYTTTFVPMGFVMRWRGHDPLAASFDRKTSTYWIDCAPSADPSAMRNQF